MINRAAQYAIQAVIFLALESDYKKRVNIKTLSNELNVSAPFLAKILQTLKRENLISSMKGAKGGFYLSEKDRQNSLWDIILCIDPNQKLQSCIIGLPNCGSDNPCAFHEIAVEFRRKMMLKLQNNNFVKEDLIAKRSTSGE